MLSDYITFVREREYMSGVQRNAQRIKKTAEWFTPTPLVLDLIDQIDKNNPDFFKDPNKTIIDKSCGDGNFLSEMVIKKIQINGCSLEQALSTVYGVDLMIDNVVECRKRLMGPNPTNKIIDIVTKNIVCADALLYDYSFGN